METTTNSAAQTTQLQTKETWSKPEIQIIGITDQTFGTAFFGSDLGTFS